jgi:hypothetical protein
MDSSRLLEIRVREAATVKNRNTIYDSSTKTFTKIAGVVGSGSVVDVVGQTLKQVGCNSYTPTSDFKVAADVCCGQGEASFPAPVPQPTKPCLCVEQRRYVPEPKCGCRS